MKERKYDYTDAGVDRKLRKKSKKSLKDLLEPTFQLSRYGRIIQLPFGKIIPTGRRTWMDLIIEGVGTKVLIAQLAESYETIGIDGVAMAVNDVIRSGARPLGVVDNIHAHESNPDLVKGWIKGIVRGAVEAGCPVSGGEIGDVAELIKGLVESDAFDMVVASAGEIRGEKAIIRGNNLVPGDAIIGLRSSGLHSNGVSLARKVLFKDWGGKFDPFDIPNGFSGGIIWEALEPTKIYVKPVLAANKTHKIKAAINITGDAYLKFGELMKFSSGIGFCFDNFRPQEIFSLIQKVAPDVKGTVSDLEMFRTFNMGWGFALVTALEDVPETVRRLRRNGAEAEVIGSVTGSGRIIVKYDGKMIVLK